MELSDKLAFIFCISVILWLPEQVIAQKFGSGTLLSGCSVTQYTGDNGLISNNITYAIQAKNGFIWATTYNGIMRFDGRKVDVFDRGNIPFLATEAFYRVYEDDQGTLWFASQGSGVVKYKNSKFSIVDSANQILPKSVRSLLIEPDGKIWAGSANNGLYMIQGGEPKKIDLPQLNQVGIQDLIRDADGNLWIATDGQGLYRFDGKKLTLTDGLLSETINVLFYTKDKTLLVGTSNGLNYIRQGRVYKFDPLKDFQINCFATDSINKIWVGTELGLAHIGLHDQSFEFLSEQDGYPLAKINSLCFDRENSLWISSKRNGLVQIRESGIINLTIGNGLSSNKANMIFEAPDQKFYIGTDAGIIDVYARGKITSFPIKTISPDAGIRDILIDKSGSLWIASYKGLLKTDKGRERLFTKEDGLPSTDFRRIIQDRQGNIWVASRSFGVAKIKNNVVTHLYNKTTGLKSNYILALEEDAHGNIYVGTHSGGLSVISPSGEIKNYSIKTDDAGILIFNIHIDGAGKVWVVSNIGLLYFDGTRFIPLNMTKIKKGETYFDWIEDRIGHVWITTNIGLLQLSKEDVLRAAEGKIDVIDKRLFDNLDGMAAKECTGATHATLSSTGKIWVPTIGGVSIFYPEKIKTNLSPLPVHITSLMVDNQEKLNSTAASPVIEPGSLRCIFQFTALSLVSPAKIQFRYKLEGVDNDWIDAGAVRQAEYTNLRPGQYTFHVVASNRDGIWNKQGDTLSFSVKPFFHQTIWFYLLAALLIATLLYSVYKWRIMLVEKKNAELKKLNNELDRFVYSASHDLRAPLASILGLINVARLDDPHKMGDYFKKIEISVHKLDHFIRDIIDFSRNARTEIETEPIEFEKLIHELMDNLMYLDEKNQIQRIVQVQNEGAFYTDRKRLTIILNNLISNALKYANLYAEHPFIEVTVASNPHTARIVVKDNGIGISQEHIDHIFKMFYRANEQSRGSGLGLYIVKEVADKIGGSVSVTSKHGEGSVFTVTLPSLSGNKQHKK
ncbi:MAG: GHKL domain-containing protein [Bacteroidetes bacterium]|nr:GHKL domain-containing protein [Bacteroidota bacterium]MBS1540969.1 GHKL domain-containing protein [Bacteroidota bacterium]